MFKAYMNWSGGKDSTLALYNVMKEGKYQVDCLLTSINAVHDRISMHGVRRSLLEKQAQLLGLPLVTLEMPEQPSMEEYENLLQQKIRAFKQQGYDYSIFGDIFLEDLRKYREEKLSSLAIQPVFPLWKIDTRELVKQFIELGFKTIVVCVNGQYLDKSFCGRIIDEQFLRDLPDNVDPCGENGEFHTFVYDGPMFQHPLTFSIGEIVYKEYDAPKSSADVCGQSVDNTNNYGFWFCDLV
ncbi:MAG: diphthine--ammonia ligase [Ferruginibacter sp.]